MREVEQAGGESGPGSGPGPGSGSGEPGVERRSGSFGLVAEDYGRLRPAPCAEAVDWLLPDGAGRVLDLAAGAGTLTALIAERVREAVAVEPDARMRAVLVGRLPGVEAHAGTAEAIPLPDASVDGVVVSSAWHWFEARRAVPEIGRVLRPGGRLGVVWNGIDRTVPWVRDWMAATDGAAGRGRPQGPRPTGAGTRAERLREDLSVAGSAFPDPLEEGVFTCTRRMRAGDAVALLGTYSRVILLDEEERARYFDRAARGLETVTGAAHADEITVPFRALCWRGGRS